MSFIWPAMLLLLLLVPLFVLRYMILFRRRQQAIARFSTLGFGQSAPRRVDLRRHIPSAFFLLSLIILIFALARPDMVIDLPRLGGTVILTFDVSGSMAADDLKPTRMEAAKRRRGILSSGSR